MLGAECVAVGRRKTIAGLAATIDEHTLFGIGLLHCMSQPVTSKETRIGIDGQHTNGTRVMPLDLEARRRAFGAQCTGGTHTLRSGRTLEPMPGETALARQVVTSRADQNKIRF